MSRRFNGARRFDVYFMEFYFSMVFTVKEVYLLHNIEKSPCRELKMEYGNGKAVRNLLDFFVLNLFYSGWR